MAILLDFDHRTPVDPDRAARPSGLARPSRVLPIPAPREEAALVALHLPRTDPDVVRRVLGGALVVPGCPLARVHDQSGRAWRRMSPEESRGWAEVAVQSTPGTPDNLEGVRPALRQPLGCSPCRVVVGEHTMVLRWHRAVALRQEAHQFFETLVRQSSLSA